MMTEPQKGFSCYALYINFISLGRMLNCLLIHFFDYFSFKQLYLFFTSFFFGIFLYYIYFSISIFISTLSSPSNTHNKPPLRREPLEQTQHLKGCKGIDTLVRKTQIGLPID